jgi:hypothetical protein
MRGWRCKSHGAALVGIFMFGHAAAQAQSPNPQSGIYSCVDAKGRKLTSDRPIAECMDREQRLLNPSGTVRARLAPAPTAQEHAEAAAKEKQEAEARSLQIEERRRDRALVTRYPSKDVHDLEREAALAHAAAAIQGANKRIEELLADRRKVDAEMEFYKKDPSKAPQSLQRQIDEIAQNIATQKRFIGEQDNETRRINTRFDEELARLRLLWLAQAHLTPAAGNAKKSP